jgi:hypothetical protein
MEWKDIEWVTMRFVYFQIKFIGIAKGRLHDGNTSPDARDVSGMFPSSQTTQNPCPPLTVE